MKLLKVSERITHLLTYLFSFYILQSSHQKKQVRIVSSLQISPYPFLLSLDKVTCPNCSHRFDFKEQKKTERKRSASESNVPDKVRTEDYVRS